MNEKEKDLIKETIAFLDNVQSNEYECYSGDVDDLLYRLKKAFIEELKNQN